MKRPERQHARLTLTGVPAPARLFTKVDRREVQFRPIDVSKVGLGLFIAETIAVGEELVFCLDAREILLQIKWRTKDALENGCFRYGLFAPGEGVDLEEMFFAYGCLEEKLDDFI